MINAPIFKGTVINVIMLAHLYISPYKYLFIQQISSIKISDMFQWVTVQRVRCPQSSIAASKMEDLTKVEIKSKERKIQEEWRLDSHTSLDSLLFFANNSRIGVDS